MSDAYSVYTKWRTMLFLALAELLGMAEPVLLQAASRLLASAKLRPRVLRFMVGSPGVAALAAPRVRMLEEHSETIFRPR